jgi:fused signal recognition particle receptor
LEGLPSGAERAGWLAAVEEALIVADVGVVTTQAVLRRLEERLPPRCTTADALVALAVVLRETLGTAAVAGDSEGVTHRPHVVLVTGVNGVGKTTTIGKLAARYRGQGKSVLLVAADTFRAAADSQLERWGERTSATVIRQAPGADPAAVVVDGVRSAIARQIDVVLIDTAGRLHTRTNLMEELRKICRVVGRECPGAPHETLLVLDATTGQNGLQQARLFREAVDLSGVVLTKMDGTAKGGIVVAVAGELRVPVHFIGLGEGVDDLQPFDAAAFVSALLPAPAADADRTAAPA